MSHDNPSISVSHLCRIKGLTSEVGKKRNGSAARVNNITSARQLLTQDPEKRNQVSIDGFAGPIAIKNKNIEPIDTQKSTTFDIMVPIENILDVSFKVSLVHQGQLLDRVTINGGAARSKGNLVGVESLLKKQHTILKKEPNKTVVLTLTDLNLARAFNKVALGETNVKLAAPLQKQFKQIQKKFKKVLPNTLVKYESKNVCEDQFGEKMLKLGPQRYNAVISGTYFIYPCPLKKYLYAHEVRYSDTISDFDQTPVSQEIYLDFGKEEATQYAKHAVALGEIDRLCPKVLAQVDPQAFWSAVLWFDDFLKTLRDIEIEANEKQPLLKEWSYIGIGRAKSMEASKKYTAMDKTYKSPEENWGIQRNSTNDELYKLANDYAIHAYNVVLFKTLDLKREDSPLFIPEMDVYKDTEVGKYIAGQNNVIDLAFKEKEKNGGKDISTEKFEKLVRKSMKSAGLKDSSWTPPNHEKICSYCQKKSSKRLLACAKCMKAFYCDPTCQRAHWKKEHKYKCSSESESAEFRRFFENHCEKNTKKGTLPTKQSMFIEKSGIGTMTVLYSPGALPSWISGSDPLSLYSKCKEGTTSVRDMVLNQGVHRNTIQFNGLNGLVPNIRFPISCGVLPDLNTAKDCVSGAIVAVRGNLENLRAPFVGLTALEFAAKKGNTEIVKWLCTDDRTKGLVQIGCPIGWSLSTGQVEIARILMEHGADPIKTDEVLFNHTPTLMVAAQNGKLEAMKFLVQECGVDIAMLDQNGKNVLDHVKKDSNWRTMASHRECDKWAKKLMNRRSRESSS